MNTYHQESREVTYLSLDYSGLLRRDGTTGTAPLHPGLLTYAIYFFVYAYV